MFRAAEFDGVTKLPECPATAAENPWRKTVQGLSFPRSGHHLLVRLLWAYFGRTFNYCEYYKACRTWPCKRSLTNFQKNHDLGLRLRPLEGIQYLVQIRHPWPAMISRYRLMVKMERTRTDSPELWETHRRRETKYYQAFVEKWVLSPVPSRLVLRYDELLQDPAERLAAVVRLFDDHPDAAACQRAVDLCQVVANQTWRDFPYASEQAIAEAERINCLRLPMT